MGSNIKFKPDIGRELCINRYCHCERSEAISQPVDNPQDCFVVLLLAMTKRSLL